MTITLKVSENTRDKMIEYFQDKKRLKTPPYAVFQADEADTVVTLYESGKVVFQGVSADIDANIWKEMEKKLNPLKKIEMTNSNDKEKKKKEEIVIDPEIYNSNCIGSDEVGTGDYFGPIVVTAAYVNKENIPFLEELGVKDSKKMTDDKILEIVPKIIKKIPYQSLILSNKEYNEKYNENTNMNKIKAILHNKVLYNMVTKNCNYDKIVVDEFAPANKYYSYLNDVASKVTNITFVQKAESKCLSVACASIISRYIFLKTMNEMSNEIGSTIPKGAGLLVDQFAIELVKNKGFDVLNKYAKLNFKNTQKIKESL